VNALDAMIPPTMAVLKASSMMPSGLKILLLRLGFTATGAE
jgi:hypothetical protein